MELFGISRGPAVKNIVLLLVAHLPCSCGCLTPSLQRDWRLLHPTREERREAVLECVLWMAKQWNEVCSRSGLP